MKRLVALAVFLFVAGIVYAALLHRASEWDLPGERAFGDMTENPAKIHVYIEPLSVNPGADSMQMRVSIYSPKATDETRPPTSDRDFSLVLGHDNTIERIEIHAHQPAPITTFDLDLGEGDVSAYPLDVYRSGLWVRCIAGSDSLPIEVTVWERVLGFHLRTVEQPADAQGGSHLVFEIRRSIALRIFVLAAYAAMAILACGALTVGALVFLGVRKPEATLMGALAGVVFALPALRNALPGAAPLGVNADIFVFLWAELAAVLAVTLLIATWARSGPRP
jgi:Domain of unknown function (DUF4436)